MTKKRRHQSFEPYNGNSENIDFKPLLFVDFEYITTNYREDGKRSHIQEIVEAAGILVSKEGYEKFDKIIKPRIYLEQSKDLELKKISNDELSSGIDMSKLVLILKKTYKPGFTKIISWGNCDLFNINHLCKIYKIPFYIKRDDYIDLSQKFRRFYNLTQAVTLEKALTIVDINEKYDKHRAMPDTEMLFKVFDKMVYDGYMDEELVDCNLV